MGLELYYNWDADGRIYYSPPFGASAKNSNSLRMVHLPEAANCVIVDKVHLIEEGTVVTTYTCTWRYQVSQNLDVFSIASEPGSYSRNMESEGRASSEHESRSIWGIWIVCVDTTCMYLAHWAWARTWQCILEGDVGVPDGMLDSKRWRWWWQYLMLRQCRWMYTRLLQEIVYGASSAVYDSWWIVLDTVISVMHDHTSIPFWIAKCLYPRTV